MSYEKFMAGYSAWEAERAADAAMFPLIAGLIIAVLIGYIYFKERG